MKMTPCFYPIRLNSISPKDHKFRFIEKKNLIYYIDKKKLDDIIKYILTEYCGISMMGYYKRNDVYWCKKYNKCKCDLYVEVQIIKKSLGHSIVKISSFVGNDKDINTFVSNLHNKLDIYQADNFIKTCLDFTQLKN